MSKAIVIDMPLLAETGWTKRCDTLIFIKCSRQKRAERAEKGGFVGKKKIKIREKYQISVDKKEKIADNIVDNNGSITSLRKQIALVFPKIMEKGKRDF